MRTTASLVGLAVIAFASVSKRLQKPKSPHPRPSAKTSRPSYTNIASPVIGQEKSPRCRC